jgi:hypothetical protein
MGDNIAAYDLIIYDHNHYLHTHIALEVDPDEYDAAIRRLQQHESYFRRARRGNSPFESIEFYDTEGDPMHFTAGPESSRKA